MSRLKNWTAKRAGGRITISAVDARTEEPIKVVGVDIITAGKKGEPPVATDKNGERYFLISS